MSQVQTTPPADRTTAEPSPPSPTSVWARRLRDLDRYDALIVAGLAAVYLLIQLTLLLQDVPLTGGDQLDYFSLAGDIQEPRITHRHFRIGMTLPVAGLINLLGYSEAAYYIVPIAAGVLFLAATYLLGALLHSRAAGTIGAIAAVFNAHVFLDSSHLVPDLMAAGLFTLGLVMIGGAADRRAGRWWNPALFGAGLLLGWAYLTREYTIVFGPLALVAAWTAGRTRVRELAQVAGGALTMLVVEFIHGFVLFGNPFAHIVKVIDRKAPSLTSPAAAPYIEGTAGNTLGEAALILPRLLLDNEDGAWLFVLLTVGLGVGVVGALVLRRGVSLKRLVIPVVWIAVVYALLTLSTWATNPRGGSVINITKIRYWYPLFPALTVGGATGLLLLVDGDAVNRWLRRTWIAVLGLAAVAGAFFSLNSIDESSTFVANGAGAEFREFRDWIADEGNDVEQLHVDNGHGRALDRILPMYARTAFGRPLWSGTFDRLDVDAAPTIAEIDGPVASHRLSNQWLVSSADTLPEYLAQMPEDWLPIFISSNGSLAVFDIDLDGAQLDPLSLDIAAEDLPEGVEEADAGGWRLDLAGDQNVTLSFLLDDVQQDTRIASIDLVDDLTGDGQLFARCDFADQPEFAFNVTQPTGDPAAEDFFCDGPGLRSIDLVIEGPVTGTISELTAQVASS